MSGPPSSLGPQLARIAAMLGLLVFVVVMHRRCGSDMAAALKAFDAPSAAAPDAR